jgi:hypothetical protein
MDEHETNTGWWTEKPDRQERPSSYAALGSTGRRAVRSDRVWLRAVAIVALMFVLACVILAVA